ncbi:MAG: nicotinate-nucleotide adenylyltransferase [Coriobacteriia bacterium]|nr:nicotinate-nucleotide adenylyltransferase [Coriobacteriia bacterium]
MAHTNFSDLLEKGKLKRLGIMGGTFDPIHFGHLVTAEHARESFNLDGVLFIPTGNPVRKKQSGVTDKELRFKMVELATEANPHFEVSRIEIDRPGDTYTVDTLRELKTIYPDEVDLFFITGADAILDLLSWKNTHDIGEMASFIAATRPGWDINVAKQNYELEQIQVDICYLEVPALAISSTYMRQRIKNRKSVRYLTDEKVTNFIFDHQLYMS